MASEIHKPLSMEKKIGQMFFIGIAGPTIDSETTNLLSEISPGGVCLFSRNIKDARQTRDLLDELTECLEMPPFLSLDQEGGLVDRLRRIVSPMPAASKFRAVEDVREFASIVAEILRILGFNMNFAPVIDVIDSDRESATNGMFSRAFGSSAKDVVELAGAFIAELRAGGILGCLKHFPGLGAASVDSHEELPLVNISNNELNETDLLPYRQLVGKTEMVMAAHAAYPNSDLQERDQNGRLLPSSLSHNFVTKVLRNELGFGGVAITDDLEMGAIVNTYGIGEACKMAINAGNDMLAICASERAIRDGFDAVLSAVSSGEIEESRIDESMTRIAGLKAKTQKPIEFDQKKLMELSARIVSLSARLNQTFGGNSLA